MSYWQERSEQVAKRQHAKTDRYAAALGREYGRAMQSVSRDIEAFYGRYAVNNEISLADARKQLTKPELSDFKMTLEEFTAKAKNNADGRWTQQLNNAYYRTRVSRFEALQMQIRQQVELLAGSRQQGLGELLGDVYEDTYYRTMFEIQRGTGIGASFARLDDASMHKVLGTEFAGSNWSNRIWADRDKLARELQTKLTQSFIRGDSVDRTVKDVVERFGVSQSNARRLVQTESAFFSEQATMDSYKESGVVDQYEILATLDGRTSEICQGMDGKVFRLSEQEVGVTYPPFHANCRTTTVPYFEDEIDAGERIARDEDGQTYYVPGDMTYGQWRREHVDSSSPPDSGMLSPNKQFSDVVDQAPGMTQSYKTHLVDRFDSGDAEAKRVFNKYIPSNVVSVSNNPQAHFRASTQKIELDFTDDLQNPRGPGVTFFHEHGHFIDHAAGTAINNGVSSFVSSMAVGRISAGEFRQAIFDDVQNYIDNYRTVNNLTTPQALQGITTRLVQGNALYDAVSDVYDGVTAGAVRGRWGHDRNYWRQLQGAHEKEMFAHMFEASFDPTGDRLDLIKEFFPQSYGIFQKILEEI